MAEAFGLISFADVLSRINYDELGGGAREAGPPCVLPWWSTVRDMAGRQRS